MKLKHINDLEIGDEILVEIPTVITLVEKVCFINKEKMFVFTEGNCDEDEEDDEDAYGHALYPNKEGYFKIP